MKFDEVGLWMKHNKGVFWYCFIESVLNFSFYIVTFEIILNDRIIVIKSFIEYEYRNT